MQRYEKKIESTKYFFMKIWNLTLFIKNNDGFTSRQTHHPTKNLTIQIMENKKRYHNATSIVGTDRLELSTTQPSFVMLSSNWNPNVKNGDEQCRLKSATSRHCPSNPFVKFNKTSPLNQPLYFADRNVRTLSHLEGVGKLSKVTTEKCPITNTQYNIATLRIGSELMCLTDVATLCVSRSLGT